MDPSFVGWGENQTGKNHEKDRPGFKTNAVIDGAAIFVFSHKGWEEGMQTGKGRNCLWLITVGGFIKIWWQIPIYWFGGSENLEMSVPAQEVPGLRQGWVGSGWVGAGNPDIVAVSKTDKV